MKKLFNVLTLLLALNFVVLLGAVGWLARSGNLDRKKILAIKQIVFPPPATQPADPTISAPAPATEPTLRLERLLAKAAGRTPEQTVDYVQATFDAQSAQIDRRERDLADQERQLLAATQQAAKDRSTLAAQRKALAEAQEQAQKLQEDQGFQNSLKLYNSMTGAQVKKIFTSLDDATIVQYLQAMSPRTAARIIKEFKTPEEIERIHRVMERMRQSTPATQPT